jgi:type II secretory pathway component PulK
MLSKKEHGVFMIVVLIIVFALLAACSGCAWDARFSLRGAAGEDAAGQVARHPLFGQTGSSAALISPIND